MASLLSEDHRSVRGISDLLPELVNTWVHLEQKLANLMYAYGYKQIRLPLLEKTALFKRAIGEVTDIIEKEMFTFYDEKNRSLSLRPEGTAGCARACLEHSLLRSLPQKLWYQGPMFRYEAPQKGRSRQFYQFGVECFGVKNSDAELEQIMIFSRLWKELSLSTAIQLEINSLGFPAARKVYIQELVAYFKKNYAYLDQDSQRRLTTNPLRILDSKDPGMQVLLNHAPKLINYLDEVSLEHYSSLKLGLNRAGIKYIENPRIVRGLDYYTGNVWEWTTSLLGAQSAVGAGGRYDNLIQQLGGDQIPAVGLAIGLDRVVLLLEQLLDPIKSNLDLYVIAVGENANQHKFSIVEKIRALHPNLSIEVDLLGGSFRTQFKRADRSAAKIAIVLGEEEINLDKITLKYLRTEINENLAEILSNGARNQQQFTITVEELSKFL